MDQAWTSQNLHLNTVFKKIIIYICIYVYIFLFSPPHIFFLRIYEKKSGPGPGPWSSLILSILYNHYIIYMRTRETHHYCKTLGNGVNSYKGVIYDFY